MTLYFVYTFLYLSAAVIAVPIARRLGLGSVLGYLIAGVIIGPVIGLVGEETNSIQHFAEFGVVMMLFLVGLELEPKMLWQMRNRLIGLGGLQVVLTTLLITWFALYFVEQWTVALTIGLILSLSSTAIVLQTFKEKGLARSKGGRNTFSVLLFQDIAVIPMLALIPLMTLPELIEKSQQALIAASEQHQQLSLVASLPTWAHALVVISSIIMVVVAGHYLSRPMFKFAASSGLPEIFTATTLMLVIGIAALMSLVGLSPALGTFLAGVILADSEFKHELESNIEPFKGLLLGLFFITVGAGIDVQYLLNNIPIIVTITLSVMLLKGIVLFLLASLFKIKNSNRWLLSLSLAQAGEFGFVLLSVSAANHVLPHDIIKPLSLVVACSMFLTPLLFIAFDKIILPRYQQKTNQKDQAKQDDIDQVGSVIIAGAGRFGQIANRMLVANNIPTVVLHDESKMVERLRRVKIKSFFGDATRPDLLRTAGIEQAKLLIISIDDNQRASELVKYIKRAHPHITVLARAYDRAHNYELVHAGADYVVSETFHSSIELATQALVDLGFEQQKADHLRQKFIAEEAKGRDSLYEVWKNSNSEKRFGRDYQEHFIKLEEALNRHMQDQQIDQHEPHKNINKE
ncbi:MAG: monovalent cation:proton antiporter-2 (CPA2) family protein [Psychromonas sp.]